MTRPTSARESSSELGASPLRQAENGLRRIFIDQINAAVSELNLEVSWYADSWIAVVSGRGQQTKIVGYTFALNDAASAEAALDKVCAYEMLRHAGVPAVTHQLIDLPATELDETDDAAALLPLVLKPHRSSGGDDVVRARTLDELRSHLRTLARRHHAVAYSPYLVAHAEYRAVVLDGRLELMYEKRFAGTSAEWRFNLSRGASSCLLGPDDPLFERVSRLAITAADALGVRVAAVDVIATDNGIQVLEVNDAFSLLRFSAHSAEHYRASATFYRNVLACTFVSD